MNKQHIPIIIGIALPVIFIIAISIYIFTARASIQPEHDFVYAMRSHQNYSGYYVESVPNQYVVEDDTLTLKKAVLRPDANATTYDPDLFIYDVEKDISRKISFEEAAKLSLDAGPSSLDGYVVRYEYGHNGIFEIFGSDDSSRGYVISKGNGEKKIAIPTADRWSDDMMFIGWIK